MNAAPESENERMEQRKPVERKLYSGATLRHLGSVRDVTLAKTKSQHEGVGSKHT